MTDILLLITDFKLFQDFQIKINQITTTKATDSDTADFCYAVKRSQL